MVTRKGSGWVLEGRVVRRFEKGVGVVSYRIDADGSWKTREAVAEQVMGGKRSVLELESGPTGWLVGGKKAKEIDGCVDVDLSVSPVTNTLAIRRMALKVGEKAEVTSAWVRFPGLTVEPLRQTYERVEKRRYRYSSATGFTSEIDVDDFGLVKRYGEYWVAVTRPS
jgi:hypothetical protein